MVKLTLDDMVRSKSMWNCGSCTCEAIATICPLSKKDGFSCGGLAVFSVDPTTFLGMLIQHLLTQAVLPASYKNERMIRLWAH